MSDHCRQQYCNADGSFKGGFDGCVAYMQCEGHSEEAAKKICGKIAADQGKAARMFADFGARLTTLRTGELGLRGGVHCDVREPGLMPGMPDMPADAPMMDFIASDDSLDRYNERIDQRGWLLDNFRRNPVVPDSHDYSSVGKILGRAVFVNVVNGKLVNRVQFAIDNPLGKMAYKMAKAGFIKSQSVGFLPLEWQNGVGSDQPARTYTKADLLEISLVAVPANPGATIGAALKSGAIGRADLGELAEYLKLFCSETNPRASACACGRGFTDAHLQLARALGRFLGREK